MNRPAREVDNVRWVTLAAHDLRHPVSAILTYSEILLGDTDTPLNEEHRKIVEEILSCTEGAFWLINDLHDFVAIGTGLEPMEMAPVSLQSVLLDSIAHVSPTADDKMTVITLSHIDPDLTIVADCERLRQTFVNLLSNAIRYSPPRSRVAVNAVIREHHVTLSVEDNGPGIPSDEFTHLFEPLQKTRSRAASPTPTTGLGLAICKSIVERHNGQIWATTEVGKGSTFSVRLPLCDSPAANTSEPG